MKTPHTFSKIILLLLITSIPFLGFSQVRKVENISDTTNLEGQFDYLFKRSSRYQEYKVIPISGYNHVKQNSLDTINKHKNEIIKLKSEISTLNTDLSSQKSEVEKLNEELKTAEDTRNSINFLGISINKGSYNFIIWTLIFILAIISAILFLIYKRGHQVVSETKERLGEVQEEFEAHRKNALVREQKLARELMDVKLKSKSR